MHTFANYPYKYFGVNLRLGGRDGYFGGIFPVNKLGEDNGNCLNCIFSILFVVHPKIIIFKEQTKIPDNFVSGILFLILGWLFRQPPIIMVYYFATMLKVNLPGDHTSTQYLLKQRQKFLYLGVIQAKGYI